MKNFRLTLLLIVLLIPPFFISGCITTMEGAGLGAAIPLLMGGDGRDVVGGAVLGAVVGSLSERTYNYHPRRVYRDNRPDTQVVVIVKERRRNYSRRCCRQHHRRGWAPRGVWVHGGHWR